MDFLTTAEYAKIWNISQRRVAIYCKEGRIEGAVLKGKTCALLRLTFSYACVCVWVFKIFSYLAVQCVYIVF